MTGKFISLEGIDGAGKSTHHAWLVDYLRSQGKSVVATREPGGTPLGEKLRTMLLSESMHLETEALLMFAARKEHLDKVILPALRRGDWVVSDRFTDASFAYQGGGRGLSLQKLTQLEQWVQEGFEPDLTFLFDVPTETARSRLQTTGQALDRFEQEQQAFFERVRQTYLDRARHEPRRIIRIDATQTLNEIRVQLEKQIASIC